MGRGNNTVLQSIWIEAKSNESITRIKDIERVNLRTYTFIYLRKLIPVYHLIYNNSGGYEIMVIWFIAIIIMFQL